MSLGRVALQHAPIIGFIKTLEAHHIAPWDNDIRRQLPLSLIAASRDEKARIEPDAAKRAFEIGRTSSPYWVGTLICEVEYHVNFGRFEDAEPILAYLREHARLQSATWLAEAQVAAMSGDFKRLRAALGEAARLKWVPDEHREQLARLWAYLEAK